MPHSSVSAAHRKATGDSAPAGRRCPPSRAHERTRSVHFPMEPVARDMQREMELELQRWVEPALKTGFTFNATARGSVSMRHCTTTKGEKAVVLKTVAMTLPASRSGNGSTTVSYLSGCQIFSSTDLSSDLSGNPLNTFSEKDAATWSQAQLLPDTSVALFHQVGKKVSNIASVVDVFTLASMLRNVDAEEDQLSGELVRMPKLTKSDMEKRGWTMTDAAVATPVVAASVTATPRSGGRATSVHMNNSSMQGSYSLAPPPHPTVFLYARDYVENYSSLATVLEDRWGRDLLPITVMPKWAHYGLSANSNGDCRGAGHASMKAEDARKLEEHVSRWLSGRARVEKQKRRLVEERTMAETVLRGAVVAAPVSEDPQRLTEHDTADIVWAVTSALDGLHRTGLPHGNVKPGNVLVHYWDTERDSASRRKVCLTDHLLPLFPDALLEPGAVLSLPGVRTRETRGYACLKTHDATVLPHMFGGGPAGAPPSDPASYTISGCWLTSGKDGVNGGMSFDGGVEGLSNDAYEAVLLQHLVAPENVLLVPDSFDRHEQTTPVTTGETYRVWVNQHGASQATDVYALGVLMWMMLVGRLPPLPQYRRVVCNTGNDTKAVAVTVDHGGRLPLSYADVLVRCVISFFEIRAGTNAAYAKSGKRLRELSTFLHSEAARAHLSLVLALARANDVHPATMDLLVQLLHTDPKHRITLAELRQHAFFRVYGSRRHELRRQYEEAHRAATLSARHSMRAPDGRALMPRQMGALAGVPKEVRVSLTRCRSELSASTAAEKSDRHSVTSTAAVDTHTSPPFPRTRSEYTASSPLSQQAVDEMFGREKWEQTCFLGPASPSLTRRDSSSFASRPTSPIPVAAKLEDRGVVVLTAAEKSLSARLRTPSQPPANIDPPGSSPHGLARTATFRSGRRWTALQPIGSAMSPPREDPPAEPLMLSVPSRRLAPPTAEADPAPLKHPLGPRRPAMRVRPQN